MSLQYLERRSDSPFVETITIGQTLSDGSAQRPAECHWHMVFAKLHDRVVPLAVGPLTAAGVASWGAGAEVLWIKFKLGTWMPHLPPKLLIDQEEPLGEPSRSLFWLGGSAWEFPTFENADTFVARLVRAGLLARDPAVGSALSDDPLPPSRTLRHRFLHTTGLSQSTIRQMARAQRAAAMLQQGVSIGDTIYDAGYFDQPHLTRSLRRFVGATPAELRRAPA